MSSMGIAFVLTVLTAQPSVEGNALVTPNASAIADGVCEQCDRALQLRSDALDARAQELAARETQVKASEAALMIYKAGFQTQVDALLTRITALEKQLDIGEGAKKAREERMTALTDTLTTLSTKKAAPMLATADPALVSDLLLRLGPQRSAALLALIPPNRAARFLEQVGAPPGKAAGAASTEATR